MNGLLIIDKPAGMTSHDVVSVVRRATGERSVGHLGTLDPMATGVLPLLLGKWTRLAQFFNASMKSYGGHIRFGWATDSYDAEGERVGEEVEPNLNLPSLQALATRFNGELDQVPPIFSAKKLGGVPAHKLARAGKDVPVKPARIIIHEFTLHSYESCLASFTMRVSAGGYVRSVAHELGQAAGCGAHLASLRRTAAGPFELDQAVTLDELKQMSTERITARLPDARTLLPEMPSVLVNESTAVAVRNGVQINVAEFSGSARVKLFSSPGELLAIGRRIAGTLVQPEVVIG